MTGPGLLSWGQLEGRWSCRVFFRGRLLEGRVCAAGYDPGSPWEEVKGEVLEADDENPALSCWEGVRLHIPALTRLLLNLLKKGEGGARRRGENGRVVTWSGHFRARQSGAQGTWLSWGEPGCVKWGLVPPRSSLFYGFAYRRCLFKSRADQGLFPQLLEQQGIRAYRQ